MKQIHSEIRSFILDYLMKHGYSPTIREIGEGVGYASSSTVFNHIRDMKGLGIISYVDEVSRTITIPGYGYQKLGKENGQ